MPNLAVTKESGEKLFDSEKITFGLVKSGYMAVNRYDGYYALKGINVDPNEKSSYNYLAQRFTVHGFTVADANSPIVFIVGRGCLIGSARAGNTVTFYYANASTSTKYYCFDFMKDTAGSGPYLKTFADTGVCTFNSLMRPLNIIASVTPPPPSGPSTGTGGGWRFPYEGSTVESVYVSGPGGTLLTVRATLDVAVGGGEYAAYLPFSRVSAAFETELLNLMGAVEGAYGGDGTVSFMFGATTEGAVVKGHTSYGVPNKFFNFPMDRYPTALVIKTAGLPFPLN
jgi:hypothetical protein